MKQNKTAQDKFNQLRMQAEEIIQAKDFVKPHVDSKDPLKLIHELQTFQIELELQIEELHRSQQELMQTQINYVELYDTAPVGYTSVSAKGLILRANLTLADMLLTERGCLINRPLSHYIVFEDQDIYYHHLRNLSDLKTEQVCELRIQRQDRTQLDVRLKSSVVLDKSRDPKEYRIIIIDISQLKRAENKLKEEMRLRTILIEALPYPTMLIRKDRTIIIANKVARNSGAQEGGLCWQIFSHGDHIPDQDKAYINQKNNPPQFDTHCTFCLADNALDELEPATSPEVSAFGKIWEIHWVPVSEDVFLCYALDITERKQAEKVILQKRKMETIGTLAGGISHNINNLLQIIIGNTELALDDIPNLAPAHAKLEEIKSASHRAAGVVKQLLDFSQDSNQGLKPIGLVTVIRNALKFLRSTLPSTVEIGMHLPDTEITILGDPIQINQVLMNICTNASQAMEKTGGTLGIDIQTIILNKNSANTYLNLSAGNHVKIIISDTGPGICADIINRVFDPYFTTKGFGEAIGMGLAVVHGIVKNHNGAITIESKPGKGTTFNILFPIIDKTPEIKIETPDEIPQGNERILFIDDEESIVNISKTAFEKIGYQVETVLNPIHALAVFQSNPDAFDLIITDMIMPEMTGVNLAEKAKAIRSDIPIIICAGHSALIDADKAKQIGIASLVIKPVSLLKIARTIRSVLEKYN